MSKFFGAAAFAVALGFAVPAMAASEPDCKARWDKADVSKSGTLEGKAATVYLEAITKRGKKYGMKGGRQAERNRIHGRLQGRRLQDHIAASFQNEAAEFEEQPRPKDHSGFARPTVAFAMSGELGHCEVMVGFLACLPQGLRKHAFGRIPVVTAEAHAS